MTEKQFDEELFFKILDGIFKDYGSWCRNFTEYCIIDKLSRDIKGAIDGSYIKEE